MGLVLRELRILLRSPAETVQSLMFGVLVVALFPLAITPDPEILRQLAVGLIWVVTLLTSLLAAERSLVGDFEDGTLEQMVLGIQPLWLICLIKSAGHWLSALLPLLLITPLLGLMLAMTPSAILWLLASLLLGTPILSLFCILGGMMTLGLNRGGALMLVILMPFLVPPLILGTQWAMTEGQAFYGYLLAGLLSLALMTLPIATATVARIVVSR
jgi:heme exporter protein B